MFNLINNSQSRIIETILKHPEINLRGIIEKTKLSPNYVSDYIKVLISREIIKERKLEKKRIYLRQFKFNQNSAIAKNILSLIYEEKKNNFFQKYPELKKSIKDVSEINKIEILIIYGSYARLSADKNSDIDILIVGNRINKEKIKETLIGINAEPSLKIETIKQFKAKKADALHIQIIKDGILIKGTEKFFDTQSSRIHYPDTPNTEYRNPGKTTVFLPRIPIPRENQRFS